MPQPHFKDRYSSLKLIARRVLKNSVNRVTRCAKLAQAVANTRIAPTIEHTPVFGEPLAEACVVEVLHLDQPSNRSFDYVFFEASTLELRACLADSAVAATQIGQAATDCAFYLIVK